MSIRKSRKKKVVLSIAGSDNTGGAGIQADIKTCIALGVYPATVITALTAQNPDGIKSVQYVGDKMLRDQLTATLDYLRPDAVKIGMIPCADAAGIIAETLKNGNYSNIVLDPVLSATAGGVFTNKDYDSDRLKEALCSKLLPIVDCLTPNFKELYKLSGLEVSEFNFTHCIDKLLREFSAKAIILTGGDTEEVYVEDHLFQPGKKSILLKDLKFKSIHTHGTGCTFSTATACYLSKGLSLPVAMKKAHRFTVEAIKRGARYPIMLDYGPVQQS